MQRLDNVAELHNLADFDIDLDHLILSSMRCRVCSRSRVDRIYKRYVHIDVMRACMTRVEIVRQLKLRFDAVVTLSQLKEHYKYHIGNGELSGYYRDKRRILRRIEENNSIGFSGDNGSRKHPLHVGENSSGNNVVDIMTKDKVEIGSVGSGGGSGTLVEEMEALFFDLKEKYNKFNEMHSGRMDDDSVYYYMRISQELRMILVELNKLRQSNKLVDGIIDISMSEMANVLALSVVKFAGELDATDVQLEYLRKEVSMGLRNAVDMVIKKVGNGVSVKF